MQNKPRSPGTSLVLLHQKASVLPGVSLHRPIRQCSDAGILGSLVCMGGFVAIGHHVKNLACDFP